MIPSGGRQRLEATVRGRVQGVGFRHFALRRAQQLGLDGWVRNALDGTVRVAAEGPAEALQAFLAMLREGPAWAHVERVEASFGPPHGEPPGFRIR
ncbi:acylphosphatase [Limnochorda sp.]|uniref:acylphosphatase n=1 Tax=Limnochorda sp. TaxID=1940279 RepID=UPI0017E423CB|nr:acylphosphatase [Limnochorda pilosa]NMA71395.1 acylphosphatase [Bacillota bacterium]